MQKPDVAAVLREMADLLEVAESNPFEVMAYRNGSQSLDEWSGDLDKAAAEGSLRTIPAIGEGLARVITDLVTTGQSQELDRVRGLVPEELPSLLRVRGLGPKRVRALWRELGVESPSDLRRAAADGRVEALKGFGAKTVERIVAGLDYLQRPQRPPRTVIPSTPLPAAAVSSGRLLAGVSGYSYAGWKGNFYPEDAAASDFLRYYAEQLNTVEINNTFYRFPSEKVIAQWSEQTSPRFLFSIKAHRRITHQLRLSAAASETITEFVERCGQLADRLGCILFQLPPNLPRDDARLETLLSALPEGPRYALEFRHDSWLDPDIQQRLAERNVAVVASDRGQPEDNAHPITADFVYARLPAFVSAADFEVWDTWFQTQLAAGRDVMAYFKHDDAGQVPQQVAMRWGANQQRLRKMSPSAGLQPQRRKA